MDQPKFMKNPASSRWLKRDLVRKVDELQEYIQTTREDLINKAITTNEYRELGATLPRTRWYGVAYIGWGTWEEDVFFTEAPSPEDAINAFEKAIKDGDFTGHGSDNPNDRTMWPNTDERILVYEANEVGEYRKTRWEKI
jgi:hypothetical protein